MSSKLVHKTIFDVTVDRSEKEANAVCDMLFERHVRPALDKVLRQFENDDMVIAQSIELDLGVITEGELEHSIADKLHQALLKYRHNEGALPVSARFIEPETDVLLNYLQKPVVPWSIDKVKEFDLRQLLNESVQKAKVSEAYLEQMATLLSDSIETCKRFFGLPFQQDDFCMLLERLISKSPILRNRVSSDVLDLFRKDSEKDFLLFKEIMLYLFSYSLFGNQQENIFSRMVVALLSNRWHLRKSIRLATPKRETIVSSPKMILARDQQGGVPAPSSVAASDLRDGVCAPCSVAASDLRDGVCAPSSVAASDLRDGVCAPSSVAASDLRDGVCAPSSVAANISNRKDDTSLSSSSAMDLPDALPAPSSVDDDAKEQAEEAPSGFHDLNTEPVAGSDTVLGFSRTSGGGDESPEIISGSGNTILGQGTVENGMFGEKLQRLIRHIDRIAKDEARFSDVTAEIERIIEELQYDEQWKHLLECNAPSAQALQKELLRLKNRTEEGQDGAEGLLDADNVMEEDVLQIAKAIESLRQIETKGRQEEPGVGIRELATAIMRTQPDLKERIPIYNAGLVLFQPFLISFFDRLGLLESRRRFKSADCQVRAVHLLHKLSGFREAPIEHLMLFNKLLCGINIMFPIDIGFEMSETERLEVERLLRATIGNWTIIRNTSIAGFQESFVKRQGVLERSQDDWILRVETKGIDILLDDIPWDVHLISFPWNDYLVYVDWKL